jgi:hypothetical protein
MQYVCSSTNIPVKVTVHDKITEFILIHCELHSALEEKKNQRIKDGTVRHNEGLSEGTNKKFHNIRRKYMERLLKSQKKSHCKQNHCESKNQGRIKTKQQ